MSYSTLGAMPFGRGLTRGALPTAVRKQMAVPLAKPMPYRQHTLKGGLAGIGSPTLSQLAQFLENYKGYTLALSPATNSIAAYPQGMGAPAFKIQLAKNEPTDAGLSKARAMIDGAGSMNGLGNIFNQLNQDQGRGLYQRPVAKPMPTGGFNPHNAWGNRYRAAPTHSSRSGNGLRRDVPFFAAGMMGLGSAIPVVLDPPIDQQEIRFDAPSLTIYMGSNKIALIPALISALAVKMILLGGSKVSSAATFWKASDKAARKVGRA